MLGTIRLQEWIHRMELGGGVRYLRWLLVVVAFAMLAVVYDSLCFRNFNNPESMDAGQLGRNIAEGRGYTTLFVRPVSIGLIRDARPDKSSLLKEGHPDISNAPVYPLLLAGLFSITPTPGDLAAIKGYNTYPPEMFMAILNQMLLGLGALLVFGLALRWFNRTVAWVSVLVFILTELYWRFSISGLSTVLLLDLVLLLAWLLNGFEQRARAGGTVGKLALGLAGIGLVTGLAMLTRYSMGWLIVPAAVFVAVCTPGRRWASLAVLLGVFAVVVTPWVVRNVMVSGLPFGTATYAVLEGTPGFPADLMERSIDPAFTGLPGQQWQLFNSAIRKGMIGFREIVLSDLPRLGGSWLWPFFLVGLLVRFQSQNLGRLRWWVVGSLALLIPVQALTKTHLGGELPEVNSENLLVVFSPLVLIFAVGLFFVLFESRPASSAAAYYGVVAGFVALVSLPLLLTLLPPRTPQISLPYYAPRIQQLAHFATEREMLMSDVPWAVAWYGQRQCVSLTPSWRRDFFEINDFHKPINGLYVSGRTTDGRFISNWYGGENRGWGEFMLQCFVRKEIPHGFPLKKSPEGLFTNGELFLMDNDRWSAP